MRQFFWFLLCLIIGCGANPPKCDDYFKSGMNGGKLSINIPSDTQKKFRIKILFQFKYKLLNVNMFNLLNLSLVEKKYNNKMQLQTESIPGISIDRGDASRIWEYIASTKPIKFRITFNSYPKNYPEIARVVLDDVVFCENQRVIHKKGVQKEKSKTFILPERESQQIEENEDPTEYGESLDDYMQKEDVTKDVTSINAYHEPCGNSSLAIEYTQDSNETYPWFAKMYINGTYICPATFISMRRAVTAAHCLERISISPHIYLYLFSKRCK